jgi:HD-GYP domain-containing protein (c-di-GMP phosphodiesterase class II)
VAPLHLALVAAALLLGLGDILTFPLVMARDCPEPPRRVIRDAAREAWAMEGIQVLLGLAAALVARAELWALAGLVVPVVLVYRSFKRTTELQDSTRLLLERLADTVDLRDPYTGGHSRRVTDYCAQLLAALGMHGAEVELVLAAARVHDIGKIGIPDAILNKPGKLTDAERAEMERHPVLGADLLARQGDVGRGVEIVRHHHEAWDGSGYPAGLAGRDIPFGARVIAVADSYDAMTSDRPYRAGMPRAKALSILRAGRGQQWDPTLVDAFLRALGEQEGLRPAPATGGATDPTEPDALRISA